MCPCTLDSYASIPLYLVQHLPTLHAVLKQRCAPFSDGVSHTPPTLHLKVYRYDVCILAKRRCKQYPEEGEARAPGLPLTSQTSGSCARW
mgnify:CR=1 FL=1